jgi:Mg-chelatase subunit ChlD
MRAEFAAKVAPSRPYFIRVVEPPRSIAVAYDLSGSLMPYLDSISRGLSAYSSGIKPKREAVNYLPFEQPFILKNFTDQSLVLERGLIDTPVTTTSSWLEITMVTALRELGQRRGARAILVITDAATTYDRTRAQMWEMIAQVRPRIFAAHISAFENPMGEKQIMQDLALANGGLYWYVRNQAEMDVAFARVAAWMRRPARYRISTATRLDAPVQPGAIQVELLESHPNLPDPPKGQGGIELILDASGSMLQRLEGKRRIEIARAALKDLVSKSLQPWTPMALRVFGHSKPGSCETSLAIPLSPLDPASALSVLDGIQPQNLARTPIGASLKEVANDLQGAEGLKTVVLITDGEETCDGDPRAEISALAQAGIDVRVNIVGFAVDDEALKARFGEWARAGNGIYIDARNGPELTKAVEKAAMLPFAVLDNSGKDVAQGFVGGPPVELPPGTYSVRAGTTVLEKVIVEPRLTRRLQVAG